MNDSHGTIIITPNGDIQTDIHSNKGECMSALETITRAFADIADRGPVAETMHDYQKDAKVVANVNQG